MPLPYIRRRKKIHTAKLPVEKLDPKTLIEAKMTFHTSMLSIIKSLFACLFVFAATPIAILSNFGIEKHKDSIFELTSIVSLTMYFSLALFVVYTIIILSRGRDKDATTFVSKLNESNLWICVSSFVFIVIIVINLFTCISHVLKTEL